ncbi:acyltransferase [Herbaspirillum rubrisubalbicans]|uniref:acyltransferase n=1 Tax=Herbaspirillum rubrisubalbicans TaxID=80842 RepID=UPI0018D213CA|nr:acyltransferase [Herbaspirillum rubrisubalbicans]
MAIDRGFEWLAQGGTVILEDHVVLGRNVKIYNFSNVSVGSFCMFAGEVLIANGGHDTSTFLPFSGNLSIGRGCWIGTGVKIVGADLEIGDNAVLGAGALVNKSVPPGAIVGGVPARILGYRELPEKVWHLGGRWFSPVTFELLT